MKKLKKPMHITVEELAQRYSHGTRIGIELVVKDHIWGIEKGDKCRVIAEKDEDCYIEAKSLNNGRISWVGKNREILLTHAPEEYDDSLITGRTEEIGAILRRAVRLNRLNDLVEMKIKYVDNNGLYDLSFATPGEVYTIRSVSGHDVYSPLRIQTASGEDGHMRGERRIILLG